MNHRWLDGIVTDALADPAGSMSPASYDTAWLVRAHSSSPEMIPHALAEQSVSFLLRTQLLDGSWGPASAPDTYRVVPTLAAVCALVEAGGSFPESRAGMLDGAFRGLIWLTTDSSRFAPARLPDTGGIEVIVAALVEDLMSADLASVLPGDGGQERIAGGLRELAWYHVRSSARLRRLRAAFEADRADLPPYIDHLAEVFRPSSGEPTGRWRALLGGTPVGCSPAASAVAASLRPLPSPTTMSYLDRNAARLGGAQPNFLPIGSFERSWMTCYLAGLGHRPSARPAAALVRNFRERFTETGMSMGEGAPSDADTTATTLLAMSLLGRPMAPESLSRYEDLRFFVTYYRGESTPSVTTNAHVLAAVENWCHHHPRDTVRYADAMTKARDLLLDSQNTDGLWTDRWHASPYYAAANVLPALSRTEDAVATAAVRRGVRSLLSEQRADGSWGRWCPTIDETAHAVYALLAATPVGYVDSRVSDAGDRAVRFLTEASSAGPDDPVRTPLWHGKELYEPRRIVRCLTIGILNSTRDGEVKHFVTL